ncbi:MAG: nicotinate-nucleotide adenylyltransferase [Chromatocurvus sp.]
MTGAARSGGVAIFGGTFNPIHHGHLRSAVELPEHLPVAGLRFMPCALPPHREPPGISARQRAAMIELAIEGESRLSCDIRELERSGLSYTIDSLCSLRQEIGPRRSLILVMGCDALLGLDHWHRWQELLQHCHIVAIARPGWEWPTRGELADYLASRRVTAETLSQAPAGGVCTVSLRPLPISATEIRSLLQSGLSARYLVPDAVHTYIHQHSLYRQRGDDCQDK